MIELLAPAGGIYALKNAVYNGANAVYLGMQEFNARMKADNFNRDNLKQWVDFCHLYRVRVYLTLNIAIKDNELEKLKESIIFADNIGIDALIVADLAVVDLTKKYAPKIQLHASTQMGIHNLEGAKIIQELGFSRVVLAREATLDEIKSIKNNTNLEIEYFVHGALCVSFSGGCLFSSLASGNSGNRGQCLQPCRKKYFSSLTGKQGYYLSPKDQCLVENLKELIECGVTSFKIEGRMKSSEYVGGVTKIYANAIIKAKKNEDIIIKNNELSILKRLYNRGDFSKGYAFDKKSNLMCYTLQGHKGELVGKILESKKFKQGYVLKVNTLKDLYNGDGCKILNNGLEFGGFSVSIIEKKDNYYSLFSMQNFPKNSEVYLTYDKHLAENINNYQKKINVDLDCQIVFGEGIKFSYNVFGESYFETYRCDIQLAKSKPTEIEDILKQLSKTGDTEFALAKVSIGFSVDEKVFIPLSIINDARRKTLEGLRKFLISSYKRLNNINSNELKLELNFYEAKNLLVEVDTITELNLCCDYIIGIENLNKIAVNIDSIDNYIFIKLPKIALIKDIEQIFRLLNEVKFKFGIYADNYYALEIARRFNAPIIFGFGLNIFNSKSVAVLNAINYCVSTELKKNEQNDLNGYNYAFGNMPIMTLAHCPVSAMTGCKCDNCGYIDDFKLSDEFGEYNISRIKMANCQFVVRYGKTINLTNDVRSKVYLDLCGIKYYNNIINSVNDNLSINIDNGIKGSYTRGVK